MARGKKKKARPARKAEKQERDSSVAAVSELVSVLACPKAAVNELALSCEQVIDQMDIACGFARFASSAWAKQPGPYGEIDEIARELIAEYEQHANKLAALLDRLAPLAEEDEHADHEDLEPKDVFARIEPMLTAQ